MKFTKFVLLLIYFWNLIPTANAQLGIQFGASETCIYNSNKQTLYYPFSPILNYEFGLKNYKKLNDKMALQLEGGYTNKGAVQKTVANNNLSNSITTLGYLYSLIGLQYKLVKNINAQLNIAPSYLIKYKKYDNNITTNYYPYINYRYKWDACISFGISTFFKNNNEIALRYNQSTAAFASSKSTNNSIKDDNFYNIGLSFLYTYYIQSVNKNE